MMALAFTPNQVSPRPVFIWRAVCFGLLGGFIIGYWLQIPKTVILITIVLAVIFYFFNVSNKLVTLFVIGCLAALLRGNGLVLAPPENYFVGEQEFKGQIVELPRLSERTTRYIIKLIEPANNFNFLLTNSVWPEFNYGDELQIKCQVEPVSFQAFTNRGIYRQCAFPEVSLIKSNDSGIRHWLYAARKFAGNKIRVLVAEPYATMATGMLWGDDSGLSPELSDNFRRTGTSHLLAVSGFNVMVLTQILFWFLISLGLWRRQASVAVFVLTGLFVIFSGAEPSVVRAGAMGSVLLLGQLLSRKPDNLNILSGTAAVMLLIKPNLITELGWQLSFAAMVGLTYISPLLRTKLTALPEFLSLRQAGSETLAATLVTTPIILVRLGTLSIITPIANLIIAPVVSLVYWFGLSLLLLSFLGNIVASPVVWLLTGVLLYMVTVIDWLASLPWASVEANLLSWMAVVLFYMVISWWLVGLPKLFKSGSKNL